MIRSKPIKQPWTLDTMLWPWTLDTMLCRIRSKPIKQRWQRQSNCHQAKEIAHNRNWSKKCFTSRVSTWHWRSNKLASNKRTPSLRNNSHSVQHRSVLHNIDNDSHSVQHRSVLHNVDNDSHSVQHRSVLHNIDNDSHSVQHRSVLHNVDNDSHSVQQWYLCRTALYNQCNVGRRMKCYKLNIEICTTHHYLLTVTGLEGHRRSTCE